MRQNLKKHFLNGQNFFQDIIDAEKFKEHTLKNTNQTFLCDDKIFGYAKPLSKAQDLKGITYTKVRTIIFDEYIIENPRRHYLKNEVNNFLGVIESIARTRDVRIFFLGNSATLTNPYYLYFNLQKPYNSDIKTYNDGLILIQDMQNIAYREEKKRTRFGKLVAGTEYENYAIENKPFDANYTGIQKKTATAKCIFAFKINQKTIGVWFDYNNGLIFCSKDVATRMIFELTMENRKR